MTTDISEKGLEGLIVRAMTGRTDLLVPPHTPTGFDAPVSGGTGWLLGDPRHYDRGFCVDLVQLRGFLELTQPKAAQALALDSDSPTRRQFLARLSGEIGKRGVIDVLRKGVSHGPHHLQLCAGPESKLQPRVHRLLCARPQGGHWRL
jgi:type I restriction enzyme R subunit